ncbi:COG1361 family protein [Jiangella alkaliphila]|uniref:Gram-positive cocci surface proteins LPxTG domain-containing protein n=1 Tax=Jiangella alkaliphila TaxID=419479 RepID=A0A1H2M195_9ACTN|nr:hypothetical protein [Jiangella alkaliphila]SDU86775.1 hypothetical protein SAMN04488563_6923 [Jiangella alkaliphila]
MPRTHTHRRHRPLGLLLAASALALGPLAGSAAATPSPEPTAEAEVVLEATLDPRNVFASPGSVVPLEATVTNTGTADMTGGSADFEVTGDATVVGVEPGDGCEQVSPQRVECHTDAALAAGESATATFEVQLPDNVSETIVGDATLTVAGDNGGEATATSILEVGPPDGYHLRVTAPASAEGAAAESVDLLTTVSNDGGIDLAGASLDVEVPDGATITGVTVPDLVPGTERPDEGCAIVTPRRLECHTEQTLIAYDGYYEATVEVLFDDDAPAGELGVATVRGAGDQGGDDTVDTAEVVLTVLEGGGTETGGTETGTETGGDGGTAGGNELPNTGGDELADTGAGRLPVLLAGAVLLAAGGALLLRTRRT